MVIRARLEEQMEVSETMTEAILHLRIPGPANLSLRWEIDRRECYKLTPDRSHLNRQQGRGFSELWL